MRSIFPCILAISLIMTGFFAGAQDAGRGLRDVVDPNETAPEPSADRPGEAHALPQTMEEALEALPLVRKVSQLMLVTLEGLNGPNANDRQLLSDFPPGGVIVPRVTRPATAAGYVSALRGSAPEAMYGVPLFIGTDLLTVTRFQERPGGFYFQIPSMMTLAAAGESKSTSALFDLIGEDMRTMGFNFHFGPSLELASELPGQRGQVFNFGNSPEAVAALGRQFGEAMKGHGVAWIPRGFPGGGQTHDRGEPAVLLTPRSRLREHDLLPYEAAVESGAAFVHVGNTLVPTIDQAKPASLSPLVMKRLLGDVLEFDGLVIAGPIDGRAIRASHDPSQAAVEALIAGADMLYWESSGQQVIKAILTIAHAVQQGALDEAIVERAYLRILGRKKALGLGQQAKPEVKVAARLEKKRSKSKIPLEVERGAITLVKNQGQVLPLTEERSQPIGVTGVFGVEDLQEALEEYIEPVAQQRIRTANHLTRIQQFEIDRLTRRSAVARTVVCILSNAIDLNSQLRLLRTFRQRGLQIVVVAIGYPEHVAEYAQLADAVVLAYSSIYQLEDTMKAVADILAGNGPVGVLPPLRDLELTAGQEATFDVHDVIRSPVGRLPVTISPPFEAGYSVSYRPVLAVEDVRWDFGDGKRSRDPVARHTYKKPGQYEIELRVEGDTYEPATGTFTVVVR